MPNDWIVLRNDDEQYCLWPALNEIPPGWRPVGLRASKADALAYIESYWTDMRPRRLRN
jgi:MbtH protein